MSDADIERVRKLTEAVPGATHSLALAVDPATREAVIYGVDDSHRPLSLRFGAAELDGLIEQLATLRARIA